MGGVTGKVAIVTGAARGQGAATARLLVERAAMVVLADVLDADGAELARTLGGHAQYRHLDVADAGDWAALIDHVAQCHGRLDALVNNAGIFRRAPLGEHGEDDFDALYRTNQLGPLLGMRAAFAMLAESRGAIVNIASTAAVRSVAQTVPYAATKWAVRGMTRAAAAEFAAAGVRVNCVIPGLIDTAMAHLNPSDVLDGYVEGIPLRRMGEPREVAYASAFLISDEAAYLTGAELTVDGGDTL